MTYITAEAICKYRKIAMPGDMNPGGSLFGGTMMSWLDEAAAQYAMCQLQSKRVVTVKVTDLEFKHPVKTGDVVEFYTKTGKVGTSSFEVEVTVVISDLEKRTSIVALKASLIFVQLNENGRPTPHRFYLERVAELEKSKQEN